VTLFASGDSVTQARLVAACPHALRLDEQCVDQLAHGMVLLDQVFRLAPTFDLLHFHIDYLHFPLSIRQHIPHVTTLHGRLDIPDLVPVFQTFPSMPVVSISDAQRTPLPWLHWQGTVYHGLPEELYTFQDTPGSYLAFLGRISPEKGVEQAIAIARQAGIPLKIVAKIDQADREYFQSVVQPLLDDPLVEYLGEMGERDKNAFLGRAYALLFPIDWPEPFGLVMIEALACGTPVIAYGRGSVPEVLEDGVTGWIVTEYDEAVRAVARVSTLRRTRCRQTFEERFSVTRMTQDYLRIYQQLLESRTERTAA
jgi:glycosyltransferase involved in cell wall biosynthesis